MISFYFYIIKVLNGIYIYYMTNKILKAIYRTIKWSFVNSKDIMVLWLSTMRYKTYCIHLKDLCPKSVSEMSIYPWLCHINGHAFNWWHVLCWLWKLLLFVASLHTVATPALMPVHITSTALANCQMWHELCGTYRWPVKILCRLYPDHPFQFEGSRKLLTLSLTVVLATFSLKEYGITLDDHG